MEAVRGRSAVGKGGGETETFWRSWGNRTRRVPRFVYGEAVAKETFENCDVGGIMQEDREAKEAGL